MIRFQPVLETTWKRLGNDLENTGKELETIRQRLGNELDFKMVSIPWTHGLKC
jgi:hypothetical protein